MWNIIMLKLNVISSVSLLWCLARWHHNEGWTWERILKAAEVLTAGTEVAVK